MAQKSEVVAIAAIGKNRELGKGPNLIWRLSQDLKRFKALTLGSPVIMGRKTFESIGKALPGRINIVVTRDRAFSCEQCVVVHSVEQALSTARGTGAEKIFVIGGGEIYRALLPLTDTLELTLIEAADENADVFFPEFEATFREVAKEKPREDGGVSYVWATYKKT